MDTAFNLSCSSTKIESSSTVIRTPISSNLAMKLSRCSYNTLVTFIPRPIAAAIAI